MTFNFETLTRDDVASIALQRTSSLLNVPRYGRISYALWAKGFGLPLTIEASLRRRAILESAWCEIVDEFDQIREALGAQHVDRVVDIGCGHGLIGILVWRSYRCNIELIDIEETNDRHHNFNDNGAGYASLDAAERLLIANGVPASSIRTTNPTREPPVRAPADLAISLLSCGFHYPADAYRAYLEEVLKPGGALVLDMRRGTNQEEFLEMFASVEVISSSSKSDRLLARR